MRVTVHIPDSLGPRLKQAAENEGLSLSALTAKAVDSYLRQKKKKQAGAKILDLILRDAVASDALEQLEKGRDDDRA